jgi:hypothetical protein
MFLTIFSLKSWFSSHRNPDDKAEIEDKPCLPPINATMTPGVGLHKEPRVLSRIVADRQRAGGKYIKTFS